MVKYMNVLITNANVNIQNPNTLLNSIASEFNEVKGGVQRCLLIAATAGAVLSLVPPFRLPAALAVRSAACLSSLVDCTGGEKKWLLRLQDCTKLAVAALGLVGLATATPALIIASLTTDIALQALSFGTSVCQGDLPKALVHASILAVDVLAVAGIALASWKLMALACAVSTVAMLTLIGTAVTRGENAENNWTFLDAACYTVLAGVGIFGTFFTIPLSKEYFDRSLFTVKNDSDNLIVFYDKQGNEVMSVHPHETTHFDIPYNSTNQHMSYSVIPNGNGGYTLFPSEKGSYIQGVTYYKNGLSAMQTWDAESITTNIREYAPALESKNYSALPLGGPTTVISLEDSQDDS